VAVAAEPRITHSETRMAAAPAVAPSSLSRLVRDSTPAVQTEAPAKSRRIGAA